MDYLEYLKKYNELYEQLEAIEKAYIHSHTHFRVGDEVKLKYDQINQRFLPFDAKHTCKIIIGTVKKFEVYPDGSLLVSVISQEFSHRLNKVRPEYLQYANPRKAKIQDFLDKTKE